jgi:transposase-like protein
MRRPRRTFGYEFKKMIVELAESGQYSLNQIARDHDIAPGLIVLWRDKMIAGDLVAGPTLREKQLEAELDRYKKKVGELTVVVDVLKKHLSPLVSAKRLNASVESPRTLVVLNQPAK